MKSSRRNFLLTAVTAPLAASLDPWGRGGVEALVAMSPGGPMQFENPQIIRYDSKCFTIDEQGYAGGEWRVSLPPLPQGALARSFAEIQSGGIQHD